MTHESMPTESPGRVRRTPRAFARAAALLLIATYVGVLYHVADVAGSVPLFAGVVLGSGLLATLAAQRLAPRVALAVASTLLVGGLGVYLDSAPAVYRALFDVRRYLGDLLAILAGRSVLLFLNADVWATAVAPAAVFLPWYLALRARYDAAALAGGLTLGFFVLTGDASYGQTLLGVAGVFGLLGFGRLDHADADWSRVRRFGLWVVVAVLGVRAVAAADPFPSEGADTAGSGGSSGAGQTLEGSLVAVSERVRVTGSISLTADRRFVVEADRPALWHAGAYDRYTGRDWIRTGDTATYDGRLDDPPGETTTLRQRVTAKSAVQTLPAAWKPTRVSGAPEGTEVTDLGGLLPGRPFRADEAYTVESEVPVWNPERLRAAGTDYPDAVASRYTRVPSSTPDRVATLADHLAADADGDTPYDVAVAVEGWLEATKEYSLSVPAPDGDAAADFLFRRSAGYCVHFATAMAVLLRTRDVPARLAVGYSVGEQVDERRWLIRGLHSHAWVEVYFPGVGWVPFDPTPGDARRAAERDRLAAENDAGVPASDSTTTTSTTTTDGGGGTGGNDTGGTTAGGNGSANGTRDGVDRSLPGLESSTTTTQDVVAGGGSSGGVVPSPGGGSGGGGGGGTAAGSVLADRDRVAGLAGGVALLLGAYQTGLFERGYREVWARYQPRTDDPAADVERAVARASYALGERHRERRDGETFRQYVDALPLAGRERDRVERLAEHYERVRYAEDASPERADEAVAIADELVRGG